jgi:hypothetical protein
MSRITDSARLESCTLKLPGVCRNDTATTVWAHWNQMPGGKAKGKKLAKDDAYGAYACYACHMVLDGQAKRPDGMTLEFVQTAMARAVKVCEGKLKEKGLWPSDDVLSAKPVTVQRIEKTVRTPEERAARAAKKKSREPVRAGSRGIPSFDRASNVSDSKRIVAGSARTKENAPKVSRFPQGRRLQSANRLQSRSFGAK